MYGTLWYGSGAQHSAGLPKTVCHVCSLPITAHGPTYVIEFDVPVYNGRREVMQVGQHRRELLAPTQEVSRG